MAELSIITFEHWESGRQRMQCLLLYPSHLLCHHCSFPCQSSVGHSPCNSFVQPPPTYNLKPVYMVKRHSMEKQKTQGGGVGGGGEDSKPLLHLRHSPKPGRTTWVSVLLFPQLNISWKWRNHWEKLTPTVSGDFVELKCSSVGTGGPVRRDTKNTSCSVSPPWDQSFCGPSLKVATFPFLPDWLN